MKKDKSANNSAEHVNKIFFEYQDWSKEKQNKVIKAKLMMFSQQADIILKKKIDNKDKDDFEDV